MKTALLAVALLFVTSCLKAQSADTTEIAVDVQIGDPLRNVLGNDDANEAELLAEKEIIQTLQDLVRYFRFVASDNKQKYKLTFRIDRANSSSGMSSSLYDYYVFLKLLRGNNQVGKDLVWLFRDAASSMNGADSPLSIAQKLKSKIKESQHERIVKELLKEVSFTSNATLIGANPDDIPVKGWFIHHSAAELCLDRGSVVTIYSNVPNLGYEEKYQAQVKKYPKDPTTILTKATGDLGELLGDPAKATVVAVHVIDYLRHCDSEIPLTDTPPNLVDFSTEGGR